MEKVDEQAAADLQVVFDRLQSGPWHTGSTGAKGQVVTETLLPGLSNADNLERYTDKYIQRRVVGRTTESYPINPKFLPKELYSAAGLRGGDDAGQKPRTTEAIDLNSINQIAQENLDDDDKSDADIDKDPELEEDEFEELDDDDYNAEKYFDDGEEFGELDDGDDEAAY